MQLCKYKNIFGKPREGVHSYRVFDIAIFDVIGTVLIGWLIAHVWKLNVWYTVCFLFVLGIICHRLFCVRTTVDKWLFRR